MSDCLCSIFPRIWDLDRERSIIGETRVSWLVESGYLWVPPIKVSKKTPNKIGSPPAWFFSELDQTERLYVIENASAIIGKLYRTYPIKVTADQLRQIAAIIGYEEPGGAK